MRLSFWNTQFCASSKELSESSTLNKAADKQHLIQILSDMEKYAVLSFQSQFHTSAKLSR